MMPLDTWFGVTRALAVCTAVLMGSLGVGLLGLMVCDMWGVYTLNRDMQQKWPEGRGGSDALPNLLRQGRATAEKDDPK